MAKKKYRLKKKAAPRLILAGFLLLVAIGILAGAYILLFTEREQTISMTPTPVSAGAVYLNTGTGIMYQGDGMVEYYDFSHERNNYTYGAGADDIRLVGSSAMTAVYNPSSLQIVGNESTFTFTGTVHGVECGKNYLAALREDDGGNESLLVFTAAGEQLDQLVYSGQTIVNFGFYTRSGVEYLWVQSLNVTASVPITTITTYQAPGMQNAGIMQIQSQLVERLYITADSVFVIGTNHIIRYTHDGNKKAYRETIYGYTVLDMTTSSSGALFLLAPREGDVHMLKILTLAEESESDKVETYFRLSSEAVGGCLMNGQLVAATREKLYTYSLTGRLRGEATLELPIDSMEKLTDTRLLLASGGRYYIAKVG